MLITYFFALYCSRACPRRIFPIYILVCGCLAHKRICQYARICPNKATCANTRHRRTDVQHLVVTGVRRRSRCARRRARRAGAPRSRSTRAPPPERRVERVERETRRQGAAEDDRRVEHVAPRCATTECDRTRNALNARDARARRASVVTCDRALLKAVTHGRSVGARARERAAAASARGETATMHAHAKEPPQPHHRFRIAFFSRCWRKRPHNSHKIATYSMKKISSLLSLMVEH